MRLLSFLLLCFWGTSLYAEEIVVAIPEWEHWSEADGSGYYWDVFRQVYEPQGIKVVFKNAIFKRVISQLEEKTGIDASAGFVKNKERLQKFSYPKTHIDMESSGIIYLKTTSYSSMAEVTGIVGKIRGYDYSSWIPANVRIFEVNNTEEGMKLLLRNRIQYMADAMSDIRIALNQMDLEKSRFSTRVIQKVPLYAIFTKDARGERLANLFDSGMERLKKSGELKKIIEKYEPRVAYELDDLDE